MNSIIQLSWFLAFCHLKTCLNLRFTCGKWMRWIYFKIIDQAETNVVPGIAGTNTAAAHSPDPPIQPAKNHGFHSCSIDIWSQINLDHGRNHPLLIPYLIWYHYHYLYAIWFHESSMILLFFSDPISYLNLLLSLLYAIWFHESSMIILYYWSHILSESSIFITNKNQKNGFLYAFAWSQLLTQDRSASVLRRPSRLEGLWSDDAACENSGRPRSKSARHQGFFGGTFGEFFVWTARWLKPHVSDWNTTFRIII